MRQRRRQYTGGLGPHRRTGRPARMHVPLFVGPCIHSSPALVPHARRYSMVYIADELPLYQVGKRCIHRYPFGFLPQCSFILQFCLLHTYVRLHALGVGPRQSTTDVSHVSRRLELGVVSSKL
ncbi:hypothetical protein OF83DRAFT_838245 [Amylostereum chailletii]|nr:hypothetical protein OF83DRAFT_838245 [Amylostereum chailletii]